MKCVWKTKGGIFKIIDMQAGIYTVSSFRMFYRIGKKRMMIIVYEQLLSYVTQIESTVYDKIFKFNEKVYM